MTTVPDSKAARQALIRRLISSHELGSQGDLAELLAEHGIRVTQATLSRDLVEIGALKVPIGGGGYLYRLETEATQAPESEQRLSRVCRELLHSAAGTGNLVVLRTDVGAAQYLASAIDAFADQRILGTVAGDDTVLVITRSENGAAEITADFLARASGGKSQ